MPPAADVVVVGGGVMGLATARAIAIAGRSVVLLERFAVGHPHGSSHGSARIFRVAYPDPSFVRMGLEARDLWGELGDEDGHALIHPVPAISVGGDLAGLAASMREGGASIEEVSAREAEERFGLIRLDGHPTAIVEAGSGVIRAGRALEAFRRGAERAGAIVREGVRVTDLRPGTDEVHVETDEGPLTAASVVVAAGSWAAGLLASASIPLPVWTRVETVSYFDGPSEEVPILLEWGDPAITYLLPTPEGEIKAAEHLAGPTRDPENPTPPDADSALRAGAWLASRIEGAAASPRRAETCLYTMTDDERFIVERHDRIVVVSACSGHGFKFAPVIGARAAALAV